MTVRLLWMMRQATHNPKVTLFELSKECEQKSEPSLSYHGHHKVEICAIKKQLWQVGVCEVICPNPTEIHTMRKSQNLEAERWATYMKHFSLRGYKWATLIQHQSHLHSSLAIRSCKKHKINVSTYIGRVQPISNYRSRSATRRTRTLYHKTQRPLSPNPPPKIYLHIHNDIKYRPCLTLNKRKLDHQRPKHPTYKAPLVEIQHMISTTVINIQVELLSTWSEIRKPSG